MEKKFDATYNHGNTTVHITAPESLNDKEKSKIIHEMHMAGWTIIDEIINKGDEEQIKKIIGSK